MINKAIGYVLAIAGVVGIAAVSIPQVKQAISLPPIGDNILLFVSLALALVGVFLIFKAGGGGRRKLKEVPIYHGRDVIGFRRMK